MSNEKKTLAVDVLAVLRRMAGMALAMRESTRVDDDRKRVAEEEDQQAVAAVVELVEAVSEHHAAMVNDAYQEKHGDKQATISAGRRLGEASERRLAALARVKGESA
ncbi:hypothetical protein [Stenotrophomonas maltophilia]|uniref:hypothetical protein n=1 Tax=Stenotrophomonas maltophilia TaxID=40324 RepID=UPI0015DFB440|nr:hypothetical protein [Stenotrophomonas maltophilia]MBA0362737.1 hypothetical protein [Stenotrophomonas maltophilia]